MMFHPPAPGVVFNPSDRVIVSLFLPKLMTGEGIGELSYLIEFCDLYCMKPAALFDVNKGFLPFVKPNQRFVFTYRQKISQKNANGKRPRRVLDSRAAGDGGFWRSSTGEKPILDEQGEHVIGYVNTLNFYEYKGEKRSSKDANKTSWLMHEYRLPGENFQEWVICKIKDTACLEKDECVAFWVKELFGNLLLGNKECPPSALMQEAVFSGNLPLPDDGQCDPLIDNYVDGRLQQSENLECQSSILVEGSESLVNGFGEMESNGLVGEGYSLMDQLRDEDPFNEVDQLLGISNNDQISNLDELVIDKSVDKLLREYEALIDGDCLKELDQLHGISNNNEISKSVEPVTDSNVDELLGGYEELNDDESFKKLDQL
ncbi:Uncharacterized protein TCM_043195 [Theobroma cacao]|uniref:NAC domain-containing protein n=1 Tax=Theobroma cacao TaxID=3641 RepID=A0A061FPA6_THECC|nr:Uncharacterized protein TCM_043195 [Theobroma cacao]